MHAEEMNPTLAMFRDGAQFYLVCVKFHQTATGLQQILH